MAVDPRKRWLLRDGRGHPSWTCSLIVPAFAALTAKFLAGGFTLPLVGTMPVITGTDYAAAAGALLATWVARDWNDKKVDLERDKAGLDANTKEAK